MGERIIGSLGVKRLKRGPIVSYYITDQVKNATACCRIL